MTAEWTDRELEGIGLLLRKLDVDTTEETAENLCVRCHEQVIFGKPLGDFDAPEWRALGEKLNLRNLVSHGRDCAWDVNYGRLVPLLGKETVVIRMRCSLAKELCVALSSQSSGVAWDAKAVIEKALGD